MKILIVSNEFPEDVVYNPVIERMIAALSADARVESVCFSAFTNKISDFKKIRNAAKRNDLMHVHFGGTYALLVWLAVIGNRIPKFITFHGTEIHMGELATEKHLFTRLKIRLNQKCSFLSLLCFDACGFVNDALLGFIPQRLKIKTQNKFFTQHLGVDYSLFVPMQKEQACKLLGIKSSTKQVLFSDLGGYQIKRRDIAESIVKALGPEYELLLMSRVKPEMVPVYLNACDFLLLTSDAEGSPNIVREALALNVPVFSVDVGDVAQQIKGLHNSAIISRNPDDAAEAIRCTLQTSIPEDTRTLLRGKLDFTELCRDVVDRYERTLTGLTAGR